MEGKWEHAWVLIYIDDNDKMFDASKKTKHLRYDEILLANQHAATTFYRHGNNKSGKLKPVS